MTVSHVKHHADLYGRNGIGGDESNMKGKLDKAQFIFPYIRFLNSNNIKNGWVVQEKWLAQIERKNVCMPKTYICTWGSKLLINVAKQLRN